MSRQSTFPPKDVADHLLKVSLTSKVRPLSVGVAAPNPEPLTFSALLRARAHERPDQLLYTFLNDGEVEGGSLTYAELDRQARAIGALIQSLAKPGERALLLYQPGLDFAAAFFGCLYSGTIAVPVPLPRRNRSLHKLLSIVKDASPAFALTSSSICQMLQSICGESPELRQLRWLATDQITPELFEQWYCPGVTGDHLAFLQYTSGSTSLPKGVMVSHANLISNSAELDAGWQHDAQSVIVSWLPHFHDMGLIYGILQPVYKGLPAYLLPPAHFLQRPARWLRAITRYRGTHSAAPNFAYDLCSRRIKREERDQLDLSSWKVAVNGAEPVRPETLKEFAEEFAPCGFRRSAFCPGYGLAEATLKVTSARIDEPPMLGAVDVDAFARNRIMPALATRERSRTVVGCGGVSTEMGVVIVNPRTSTRCAADEIGEIWVSGPGVAQGYWNQPDETESIFKARLADTGEGPFLRTGDLGFLMNGDLFIAGRLKDLLIIGGQNHYPQDIEQTVGECHRALRLNSCIAFTVDGGRDEHLVVAVELERQYRPVTQSSFQDSASGSRVRGQLDLKEVVQAVRGAVAEEHELQVHTVLLLKPGDIPKTSSGKLQRHACRQSYLEGRLKEWVA